MLWTVLLRLFGVSSFGGKSPLGVWQYLFSDAPARGVRPASLSAAAARAASFGALGTTLVGGVLSGYKGQGNYGGVWTIVALSVLVSIVLYELMTIVETALLARWGPEAGVTRE